MHCLSWTADKCWIIHLRKFYIHVVYSSFVQLLDPLVRRNNNILVSFLKEESIIIIRSWLIACLVRKDIRRTACLRVALRIRSCLPSPLRLIMYTTEAPWPRHRQTVSYMEKKMVDVSRLIYSLMRHIVSWTFGIFLQVGTLCIISSLVWKYKTILYKQKVIFWYTCRKIRHVISLVCSGYSIKFNYITAILEKAKIWTCLCFKVIFVFLI